MVKQSSQKTTLTEYLKQAGVNFQENLPEDNKQKVCWLLKPQRVVESPKKYK